MSLIFLPCFESKTLAYLTNFQHFRQHSKPSPKCNGHCNIFQSRGIDYSQYYYRLLSTFEDSRNMFLAFSVFSSKLPSAILNQNFIVFLSNVPSKLFSCFYFFQRENVLTSFANSFYFKLFQSKSIFFHFVLLILIFFVMF
jgi:hypothetical protein